MKKKIKSSLVRIIFLICPTCGSSNIVLSDQGKLLVNRESKIRKIESNNESK